MSYYTIAIIPNGFLELVSLLTCELWRMNWLSTYKDSFIAFHLEVNNNKNVEQSIKVSKLTIQ